MRDQVPGAPTIAFAVATLSPRALAADYDRRKSLLGLPEFEAAVAA